VSIFTKSFVTFYLLKGGILFYCGKDRMRFLSTFNETNLTNANNVSSVLQYVSICHATLSDRTSAWRRYLGNYLDGKRMECDSKEITFPHTKKVDFSRSRRSSSTYENYNFPDSAKVSWLSSKRARAPSSFSLLSLSPTRFILLGRPLP